MIAFRFDFVADPAGGSGPLSVSVFAESEEEAWRLVAQKLSVQVESLRAASPTIQKKEVQPGDIIVARAQILADSDDPWPWIVSEGIKDVTSAIRETAGTALGQRIQVELARLGLDRLVLIIFSIAFLGALAFSFYLIVIDKEDPVFRYIFPIITAVIGLISGYFAGRGAGDSARR